MTVEDKLREWLDSAPGAFVTTPEIDFIRDMRSAAKGGVGYGFMQQVIEWEWNSQVKEGGWGPEYFQKRIAALEKLLAEALVRR